MKKKPTQKVLENTVDAAFHQKMKQKRANVDVMAQMHQRMMNTGSPFKSTPRRTYQPKPSWA